MKQSSTLCWLAIDTRPRQEQRAVDNLQRQGFCVYFPKIRVRKRRRQDWMYTSEPLFPGYVFIHTDPGAANLGTIKSTLGVRGLVMFGHCLMPVPDQAIAYLKSRENPETDSLDSEPVYTRGDIVEIVDGSFAGLQGVFQVDKPGDRAMLLIEMLGRQNALVFHLDQLSPVASK
ncbi:MAG: transcription termination/antitermination NusG family protein [Porticoccaceae bacterium]